MKALKDFLEIIYYISFVIFTGMIVYYTIRTFKFQVKKEYNLLCKICILNDNINYGEFMYGVEIYNFGNDVAKNIDLKVDSIKLTTIDFIKPQESFVYPLGKVCQMISCNRVYTNDDEEIIQQSPFKITLTTNEKNVNYNISSDILFNYRRMSSGSISDICESIDKLSRNIRK